MHIIESIIMSTTLLLTPFFIISFFQTGLCRDSNYEQKSASYINSLRGVAALLITIHHSVFMYNYTNTKNWNILLPSVFFKDLSTIEKTTLLSFGYIPVMVFFMITGYLFFGKLINNPVLDVRDFYKKRAKRILPLYFTMLALMLILAYFIGFRSDLNLNLFFKTIILWLTFGMLEPAGLTDEFRGSLIVCGVIWTLIYEWFFYLLIPLFSSFFFSRKTYLYFTICMIFIIGNLYYFDLINEINTTLICCFLCGLLCSIIKNNAGEMISKLLGSTLFSLASLVYLVFSIWQSGLNVYKLSVIQPLFFVFLSVCFGSSLVGLLKFKPLQISGTASYSIYLLHGLALSLSFYIFRDSYLLATGSALIFTSIFSIITYTFIERRFMKHVSNVSP